MDILYDWQFWSVVVGLLAIISGFVIYLLQRNKKRLVYSILTETPLLSVNDEIKGKIKIKYRNKNIQNIYLVLLKVENKGNVDIASTDYEQAIIFSFPDSEMLSAEMTDVSPKNLKPKIVAEPSKLIIDPILLNGKDYIIIKLLFGKYQNTVNVDARIIGVKEVERVFYKNDDYIFALEPLYAVLIGAGAISLIGYFLPSSITLFGQVLISGITSLAVIFGFLVLQDRLRNKK